MLFQHFLLPVMDPSVKHWDDKKESTWMTRKKALISYASDKKDDVMPVPRHWHPVFS